MRKFLKNNILEIFKTIYEAHEIVKGFIDKKEYESAQNLLADCQDTAIQLGKLIEESEGEGFITVSFLEEYCEALYEAATSLSEESNGYKVQKQLDKKIIKAENSAKNDIKVKLEIVFMPYKVSMWDSLESVWKAADEAPDCDAYVVPIPYYDRKPDHSFGEFHYEGGEYPDYVPVVHYESYNLEQRRPDVIYIHNPYDGNNYVTSVDPRFYSYNLKKHTECLVYIPYHISACFADYSTAPKNIPSAFKYVDYIITQSKIQKKYYESGGVNPVKILALGSPKMDFIVNKLHTFTIPDKWYGIINKPKKYLLNTSIAYLLSTPDWCKKMLELLDIFSANENIALIWRPHPLLESTIKSMRPNMIKEYNYVKNYAHICSNIVIDTENSAYPAMKIADAMISDTSSLVMQFSLTGKPTCLTDGTIKQKEHDIVCFDYFENYFVCDGVDIKEFVRMINNGIDEKKEMRINAVHASVENSDGTSGMKIHNNIIRLI